MYAFDVRLDYCWIATDDAPSQAPSGCEEVLGHAAEGDHRHIGRNRSHRNTFVTIEHELVVNLIGENDEIMLPRQLGNLLKHGSRTHCSGGIIGIDEHDPACARSDFALDIVKFRLPSVFFV